jgi:hypothetical protein
MSGIQYIIAIIGLIISIRSKNKFSNIGVVFFMLVLLQFVYYLIIVMIFYSSLGVQFMTKVITEELFGMYASMIYIPEEILGIASLVTIIVGVVKFKN